MDRTYKYYDFIMALFVAVLLISNVASAAKIVDCYLRHYWIFEASRTRRPL